MLTKLILWVTLAVGAVSGVGDARFAEVRVPALIFCVGWLLGAAQPQGAWRRALVLGLSLPLAHAVSRATGSPLPYPTPGLATSFLALVPAFAGTYAGVASRRRWAASPVARTGT